MNYLNLLVFVMVALTCVFLYFQYSSTVTKFFSNLLESSGGSSPSSPESSGGSPSPESSGDSPSPESSGDSPSPESSGGSPSPESSGDSTESSGDSTGSPEDFTSTKLFDELCSTDTDCNSTQQFPLTCTQDESTGTKRCKKTLLPTNDGRLRSNLCYKDACNAWMKQNIYDSEWSTLNHAHDRACGLCEVRGIQPNMGALEAGGNRAHKFKSGDDRWDYQGKYNWLCFKNEDGQCSPDDTGV